MFVVITTTTIIIFLLLLCTIIITIILIIILIITITITIHRSYYSWFPTSTARSFHRTERKEHSSLASSWQLRDSRGLLLHGEVDSNPSATHQYWGTWGTRLPFARCDIIFDDAPKKALTSLSWDACQLFIGQLGIPNTTVWAVLTASTLTLTVVFAFQPLRASKNWRAHLARTPRFETKNHQFPMMTMVTYGDPMVTLWWPNGDYVLFF